MAEPPLSSPRTPPLKRIRLEAKGHDAVNGAEDSSSSDDRPGDASRPETFYDCYNMGDKKIAAYLGFSTTSDLHVCAVSWPLLRAAAAIQPTAHKLNKELAFGLIRDAPRAADSAIVDKDWSLIDCDGKGLSNVRKAEHLAIVLINLKSDLTRMIAASDNTNKLQHQHDCQKFHIIYPSHICPPQIGYPINPPLLAPLEGEDFLEPYNRCFSLLRHMRNILKNSVYDNRYKTDKFKSGQSVDESHKPAWMRPPGSSEPPITQHVYGSPDQVSQFVACKAPKLPAPYQFSFSAIRSVEFNPSHETPPPIARSFTVLWDHTIEPVYLKPGLKRAMDQAKAAGVHLPSELQKLKKDPRDMDRDTLLYEQIRTQFECYALGVDMGKLLLQYNSSALGESMLVKQNLEDEAWSDTQAALADPDNDKFVFRVGFFALDDK